MMQRMKTVAANQPTPITNSTTQSTIDAGWMFASMVIDHRTSDNWACASDRAQSRK